MLSTIQQAEHSLVIMISHPHQLTEINFGTLP